MDYEKMWNELKEKIMARMDEEDTATESGLFFVAGLGSVAITMEIMEEDNGGKELQHI